jgi:ribosomal protein S18 acetylase RimI-like enzyme
VEADRLVLLEHSLHEIGTPPLDIEAGGLDSFDEILAIDNASFPLRWRLGRLGLMESYRATPKSVVHRHRLDGVTTGFAISGVGLGVGYLQRLAVAPEHRRRDIGDALVKTATRWALRQGARAMLVNTQMDNQGVAELYRRTGFAEVSGGLLLFRYQPT